MTELDCANGVNGEAIVNTRGIERLTELKSLNLSGNDISRINLAKNEKLESLKLRDTYISKLNLENNLKLSEFIINGYVIVDAATYAEVAYDENNNGHLIMNISKRDYLKNADFTIDVLTTMEEEHWEPIYDSDTNIIALNGAGMLEQIRFTVNLGGDEGTISYIVNAHPRIMYFTTYFDGKLFDQEAGIMYGFTNFKLNVNALAKEICEGFYGMSGYALEEYTIADDSDFTIGTKDVYFTFRFVKIASDDDEQDPGTGTEPGTEPLDGTDPVDEPEDEPQDVENPKTLDGTCIVMLVSVVVIASFALVSVSHRFGRRGR